MIYWFIIWGICLLLLISLLTSFLCLFHIARPQIAYSLFVKSGPKGCKCSLCWFVPMPEWTSNKIVRKTKTKVHWRGCIWWWNKAIGTAHQIVRGSRNWLSFHNLFSVQAEQVVSAQLLAGGFTTFQRRFPFLCVSGDDDGWYGTLNNLTTLPFLTNPRISERASSN